MSGPIKTISEFVERITSVSAQHDHELLWRGHSDCSYKLIPNIYRKEGKLVAKEHLILKEAVIRHPEEFSVRSSYFEKLALMQHYEFPTRLLDLTENPLVALYFACKTRPAKNGEVILFRIKKDAVKYYDSDTVSVLSALSCIPPSRFAGFNKELHEGVAANDSSFLREIKKRMGLNKTKTPISTLSDYLSVKSRPEHIKKRLHELFNGCSLIDLLVYEIQSEKPHFRKQIHPNHFHDGVVCVKSKYDSSRIAAQQGAFLLFGIRDGDKAKPASLDGKIEIERFAIDQASKTLLLKQLARMGISEERLFPEMMSSAKVIKDKLSL
jgi:hypothetical protein